MDLDIQQVLTACTNMVKFKKQTKNALTSFVKHINSNQVSLSEFNKNQVKALIAAWRDEENLTVADFIEVLNKNNNLEPLDQSDYTLCKLWELYQRLCSEFSNALQYNHGIYTKYNNTQSSNEQSTNDNQPLDV